MVLLTEGPVLVLDIDIVCAIADTLNVVAQD